MKQTLTGRVVRLEAGDYPAKSPYVAHIDLTGPDAVGSFLLGIDEKTFRRMSEGYERNRELEVQVELEFVVTSQRSGR